MNGAASGLIEAMKNALGGEPTGTDWDYVPHGGAAWFKYGGGGINCWGTLCGIPNGCCAFLNLCGLYSGTLGDKVLGYYSQTLFPTSAVCDNYDGTWSAPVPMDDDTEVLAHTVSYSPLCHVSISKWCSAAGVNLVMNDGSRSYKQDRCGKICADMAAFTAELINATATYTFSKSEATEDCMTCHYTGSTQPAYPAQCGKMACNECHTYGSVHQGRDFAIVDAWTESGSGTPETEFAPGDSIKYCVEFAIMGGGVCYIESADRTKARGLDIYGALWVDRLNDIDAKGETRVSGGGTWKWDSTIPSDAATGNCRFLPFLRVRNYENGPLIVMLEAKPKFHVTRP